MTEKTLDSKNERYAYLATRFDKTGNVTFDGSMYTGYFMEDGKTVEREVEEKYFDPYRQKSKLTQCLFTEDGALRNSADKWVYDFICKNKETIDLFSDIMHIYYSQRHGSGTKGSYPAIYMWR